MSATQINDSSSYTSTNGSGKAGFEKREKRRTIRQLQNFISQGNVAAVQEILKSDFDVDFQYNGMTSLQLAVCEGLHEICKLLIDKGANVDQADANGNSLLNMACWRGFANIAQLLVSSGADVDSQNESGNTSLNVCAYKDYPAVAKILLARGCTLNLANKRGHTPLYCVAQSGNLEMVRLLLEGGVDPDWGDLAFKTPLMVAAEAGHQDVVKALVDAGANVNNQSRSGRTALHEAATLGHVKILQQLLDGKGDPDLATVKGTTPLLEAINNSHVAASQALIHSKCDVNLADRRHWAPIHAAIAQVSRMFDPNGGSAMRGLVEALVDADADINKFDEANWTPLYQSASAGDLELCKFFLSKGANANSLTLQGSSILHAAVYGGNGDVVKLCLRTGCSVNTVDEQGRHPLLSAVSSRCDLQIIQDLVDADSDVNIADKVTQQTPLHEAMCQHYVPAAHLLIDKGSNMELLNNEGKSPLYLACQRGLCETVQYMVKERGCPTRSSQISALPIHVAATQGRASTIQVLAEAGCDVNQTNEKGETPLAAALAEDNFSAVRALLQCGADLEAQQKMKGLQLCCLYQEDPHPHLGLEPLFHAMTHKNVHMMKMLFKCYRQMPRQTIKLLEVLLKRTREINMHYTQAQKAEILELLHNSTRTMFSLSDICRRYIRACLGSPLQARVQRLPVARKVMSYILMDVEFAEWQELEQELPGGSGGLSDLFTWRNSV
ncbi:hypothetical protein RRG08_001550 [Elysia crispata]|uniref:SOCS box domain-containing protein n=1 Tax=Elysia crispata TaxID=231223 RepID=A0AAE1AK09_9GAST|nr:hypothetical protein RRG08_001550 [Elysia crispata]